MCLCIYLSSQWFLFKSHKSQSWFPVERSETSPERLLSIQASWAVSGCSWGRTFAIKPRRERTRFRSFLVRAQTSSSEPQTKTRTLMRQRQKNRTNLNHEGQWGWSASLRISSQWHNSRPFASGRSRWEKKLPHISFVAKLLVVPVWIRGKWNVWIEIRNSCILNDANTTSWFVI